MISATAQTCYWADFVAEFQRWKQAERIFVELSQEGQTLWWDLRWTGTDNATILRWDTLKGRKLPVSVFCWWWFCFFLFVCFMGWEEGIKSCVFTANLPYNTTETESCGSVLSFPVGLFEKRTISSTDFTRSLSCSFCVCHLLSTDALLLTRFPA